MNPNPPRRFVRSVLNIAIVLGVCIALKPAADKGYGWWSQRQLLAQWDDKPASARSAAKPQPSSKRTPKAAQSRPASAGSSASAMASSAASAITLRGQGQPRRKIVPLPPTRLRIADIGVDAIVVSGLDAKALARGPGHDPNSALPGGTGNCVLAAHRNTYGSWFYNLDQLWAGSVIELKSDGYTYKYAVVSVQTVSEADTSVLDSRPGTPPSLTLITCTLPHSPFRLVATAYLQEE